MQTRSEKIRFSDHRTNRRDNVVNKNDKLAATIFLYSHSTRIIANSSLRTVQCKYLISAKQSSKGSRWPIHRLGLRFAVTNPHYQSFENQRSAAFVCQRDRVWLWCRVFGAVSRYSVNEHQISDKPWTVDVIYRLLSCLFLLRVGRK